MRRHLCSVKAMIRSKASEPADCERMLLSRTRLKTLRIQLLLLRILLDALLLHRPFWMCCDVVTPETQDVASAPHLKRQHLICCNAVFVFSLKAALERDAGMSVSLGMLLSLPGLFLFPTSSCFSSPNHDALSPAQANVSQFRQDCLRSL